MNWSVRWSVWYRHVNKHCYISIKYMHGAATYEYYMCGTIVMYCNYIYIQISSVTLHGCFQCPALQVLFIPLPKANVPCMRTMTSNTKTRDLRVQTQMIVFMKVL